MKRGAFLAATVAVAAAPALPIQRRIPRYEIFMAESAGTSKALGAVGIVDEGVLWESTMPWRYYSDRLTLSVTDLADDA